MGQRTSQRRRKEELGKQLVGYSVAAGAALAVGASGADAAVIFTPADITLHPGDVYLIDFDGDGYDDVGLYQGSYAGTSFYGSAFFGAYYTYGPNSEGIAFFPLDLLSYATHYYSPYYHYAKRFSASALINTTKFFGSYTTPYLYAILGYATTGGAYYGNFVGQRGFLGVAFVASGGAFPHFAWIDLEMSPGADKIRIYGWAYESETGKPIHATPIPEPGTLALLATGAAGLMAQRRMRRRKEEGEIQESA